MGRGFATGYPPDKIMLGDGVMKQR